ncbi:MAG: GNAT family N-acetyltransferase [Oscillospiraceae bacterium]
MKQLIFKRVDTKNNEETKAIPDETISITGSEFLSTTVFNVVEATCKEDAHYVTELYGKNIEALHGNEIMFDEWYRLLSSGDTDEKHFLILKGAIPCAYLKINGLESGDNIGWISMLAVEPAFHHRGIGEYAVQYAEEFLRNIGKSVVCIHTTEDNIPAQRLYEKCGYVISESCKLTTGDGVKRIGYTFSKPIL